MMDIKTYLPLGLLLHCTTKNYIGALSHKLKHIHIERHFYSIVLIHESNGDITQREFAEALNIDKVTAVKMIDYLSEKKYVVRKVNAHDRREHLLELTDKARKVLPEIKKAIKATNEAAMKELSLQEREQFYKSLELIRSEIQKLPMDQVRFRVKKIKLKKK